MTFLAQLKIDQYRRSTVPNNCTGRKILVQKLIGKIKSVAYCFRSKNYIISKFFLNLIYPFIPLYYAVEKEQKKLDTI